MTELLGNLCRFVTGGTPPKSEARFFEGHIPWITSADITQPVVSTARSFITEEAVSCSATNRVPAGTALLVTRTGVGKVAVAGCDLCFSQDITALIPERARLDTAYLVHFLRTKQDYFISMARGATIKGITRDVVASIEMVLPSLEKQRRIAALLDKADSLRTKRRAALAQLDRLAQSIFQDAMQRAERNGCVVITKFEDVFWFQEGPGVRKWQFTDSGVKLLNVGNIEKSGVLDLNKTGRHISLDEAKEKYRHFMCDVGDLVIASSGISIQDDGLLSTRGAFIKAHHLPLCMNTSTIRFKTKGESSLVFLHAWLSSLEFRSQMTKLVTGSAQLNFGPSHLRELRISLPSKELQDDVTAALRSLQTGRAAYEQVCQMTAALFHSLQSRAFAGEL